MPRRRAVTEAPAAAAEPVAAPAAAVPAAEPVAVPAAVAAPTEAPATAAPAAAAAGGAVSLVGDPQPDRLRVRWEAPAAARASVLLKFYPKGDEAAAATRRMKPARPSTCWRR